MKQLARMSGALLGAGAVAMAGLWAYDGRANAGEPSAPTDEACAALTAMTLPGGSITMARAYPEGLDPAKDASVRQGPDKGKPTHAMCRVAGILQPTPQSHIRFEVWLPTRDWNGKYNGVGNGGAAGFIAYGAMSDAVNRGYASGSTDTGHQASLLDGSWMADNPVLVTDFAQRSQHLTVQAAKRIVATFYGRKPARAYFSGCSNGGGQGQVEAQRFPGDYDGIVNGDAARYLTREWPGELYMSWVARDDRDGFASKIPALHAAVLAKCDGKDGLKDGLIENPAQCSFDPKVMQCAPGIDTAQCLTPRQVGFVRKIYTGLRNPRTGAQFWPGAAPGSEMGWLGKIDPNNAPLPENYMRVFVFHSMKWSYLDPAFDFESPATFKALYAADRTYSALLSADNPDLRPFVKAGGKMLMYHGWADADIAALNIIDYYHRVEDTVGGGHSPAAKALTRRSARLFMVPGMAHCGNGDGPNSFDALGALDAWVEHGQAPERIEATQVTGNHLDRKRPLCPYPQQAVYNGAGDVEDSRSFNCRSAKD